MGAAFAGGHIVDKGIYVFRVGIGVLNGHPHQSVVPLGLKGDGSGDGVFILVEKLHKVREPTVEFVFHPPGVLVLYPFVYEDKTHAAVEIRQFPQPAAHQISLKIHVLKHPGIGLEADGGAPLGGAPQALQVIHRPAGNHLAGLFVFYRFESNLIVAVILIYVHHHPFGQGVYHGSAHPVKAAGILIGFVVEFSAGVQLGINHLYGGNAQLRVNVRGHAPAVVGNLAGAVLFQGNGNFTGEAVGGLVNGVVHDFPDQMMQSPGTGGANIHTRTHANGVQSFQNLDVLCGVGFCHEFPPLIK